MSDAAKVFAPADIAATLDQLTDAVVVFDREWRIAYLNKAARTLLPKHMLKSGNPLFEAPVEELIGQNVWDALPSLSESPFRAAYEEAAQSGEPRRLVAHYEQIDAWFEARALPQDDKLVVVYRDVSDEQRAENDLREFIDGVAEAERIVRFGVWRWDVASGRVRWSDELHHIYGLRPGEFAGTVEAFLERVVPEDRERIWEAISASLESGEAFAFEERILHTDGELRTLLSQGRVIVGPDGAPEALVGVCHDISERAQIEQALGASERRLRAIVDNSPSAIVVRDLDGRVLLYNAEASRVSGVPVADALGRATDEILPPELAKMQREVEQRAASEDEPVFNEFVAVRDGEPRSFVSVTFPLPDSEGMPAEVCSIATDVTERREKESERRERLKLTNEIATALDEGRMVAYAQPIVDLASDDIHARELLARLRTAGPHQATLGPEAFMPGAERFELVQAIDTHMVRQALALRRAGRLHVNVSAVTVSDPVARAAIVELLRADPEGAARIVFELTETASVERLDAARAFGAAVTELGAQLALDDFGVGFGSFSYLRSLPLSKIKIDASFVRRLVASPGDRRVVKGVLSIAREFGVKTVAEGIEDEATLEHLRELGVDFGQGYLLGRPAPLLPGVRSA